MEIKRHESLWPTACVLTILFIILRASNVIDWPWLWVWSPLWILASVVIILFVVSLVCLGLAYVLGIISEKTRRF